MRNKLILVVILLIIGVTLYSIFANKNNTGNIDNPPITNYPVVQTLSLKTSVALPHDTAAYTEGLEFYKGSLYESAGLNNQSYLVQYQPNSTIKVAIKKTITDPNIFAEGITILNDTVYQLTYQSKKIFRYHATNLAIIDSMPWANGEGWGLTNNGTELIASNGTNIIYYLKPNNLQIVKTLNVLHNGVPLDNINELEYVEGYIYANVFTTDNIMKIDPATGYVIAQLNLANLLPAYNAAANANTQKEKYLNGIAYNITTKQYYVTGKNWPQIFAITF